MEKEGHNATVIGANCHYISICFGCTRLEAKAPGAEGPNSTFSNIKMFDLLSETRRRSLSLRLRQA